MISIDAVSDLVVRLQSAALGAQDWISAMERICALTGCDTAGVMARSPRVELRRQIYAGLAGDAIAAYNAHYWTTDFIPVPLSGVAVGVPRRTAEVVSAPHFRRTEFYGDWVTPSGIHDAVFVNMGRIETESLTLCLTARRPEPLDDPELPRALRLLVPHLQMALRTRARLVALETAEGRALAALEQTRDGVVLVTPDRRILFRNTAAAEILDRRDGLAMVGEHLRATGETENRTLGVLLARAGEQRGELQRCGGSLKITRASGPGPIVIHILPLTDGGVAFESASALVLMVDSKGPDGPEPELLREVFGLTAAEAVVAARLSRGDTLKAMASDHSVSLSTIRTQLAGVFAKTNTHRQSDLVRLLLGLRGDLR